MQSSSNVFIARFENNKAYLNEEESFHCCKVLRKKVGEEIAVIDGRGQYYAAVLENVSEKHCVASLLGEARFQKTRNFNLHLAIAPTKQIDRMEWMIEKVVELGIDEISLLRCQNSERVHVNTQRLKKIIESAVKQSLQARIPELNELKDFTKFIENQEVDQKFLAHCMEGEKQDIRDVGFQKKHTLVLIGPEGDFSNNEISLALKNGFIGLKLGENRLRTETAGLVIVQAAFLGVR